MKRLFAIVVTLISAAAAYGQPASPAVSSMRAPVVRPEGTASAYSVELPLVVRTAVIPPSNVLTLNSAHPFEITLTARALRTGAIGIGVPIPQTDAFGYFTIPSLTGNADSPEVFVKIIDGTSLNAAYWFFYGGLTDLEYTLSVTEIATGRVKSYTKPAGSQCGDFDTVAFPGATAPEPADASPANASAALAAPPGSRTSVDLINNTSRNAVLASYQFSYTCASPACSPQGGFYRTTVQQVSLPGLGAFHQDDFVAYLATNGLLQPGADQGAIGTLLVTFSNLGSSNGFEANAIGNTYNRIVESDPLQGTVGFAYNASLFFDSADTTLIGFARDTTAAPTVAGRLRSDVGIRNTDINGTNQNLTVDLSFYDTATGTRVGDVLALTDVRPGELRQVEDIWTSARIAFSVTSVIVFADARNPTATSPTIEGYVLTRDTQKSQSQRFVTMLCADLNGCGN